MAAEAQLDSARGTKPADRHFWGLRSAKPNIRLATRRLSLAALRNADDDRTVDACIGLEALLGEGRDELSHRLALRAATALGTRSSNPFNAQATYDLMKKVYVHRSAVVHGTSGEKSKIITMDGKGRPSF